MHTLEFTLKQHTPLIHFQHDQEGATLRATELKPKLDRFLIKKHRVTIQNLIKITPNGHEYLDYKIFIDAPTGEVCYVSLPSGLENTEGENYSEKKIASYFGNNGIQAKKDARCTVFTSQDIKVYIVCYNADLKTLIEAQFSCFLAVTNFGTRQNKGLGSFFIKEKLISSLHLNHKHFTIQTTDAIKVLNDINLFYRCLRSGINQKGAGQSDVYYFKSLMFMYAKREGLTWDKRTMRESFYLNNRNYQQVKENRRDAKEGTVNWSGAPNREFLFRDLLGLSSEQDWQSYHDKITKEHTANEIDRFKSPITFKPIKEGNRFVVLVILDEIPNDYKNATFKITSKVGGIKNLPIYNTFNLSDFFTFCIGLDIDNHFQETNVINPIHQAEITTIKEIFRELKKQLP